MRTRYLIQVMAGLWLCAAVAPLHGANVYVNGLVPNWEQPYDYPDPYDNAGPGARPPVPPQPWDAWCTPTSAAMMMGYWADVKGDAKTGDAFKDGNQGILNGYAGTKWSLGPDWHDYTADGGNRPLAGPYPPAGVTDLGWYMNTDNLGAANLVINPALPHVGTYVGNCAEGLADFLTARGSGLANYVSTSYIGGGGKITLAQALASIKAEIDANRTVLGHFQWWVNVPAPLQPGQGEGIGSETNESNFETSTTNAFGTYSFSYPGPAGDPIHNEQWNKISGVEGLGHTVCIVGYSLAGTNVTGLIVHDNWTTTPRDVQVLVQQAGFNFPLDAITTVTGPPTLIWVGGPGGMWDFNHPYWNSGLYVDGGNVTFTDSGGGTIAVATNVCPGSMLVTNSTASYTFAGACSICGSTSLVKNGAAPLTLDNSNGYTGGTTLNGGLTIVSHTNALGTGPVVTAGAGTALHFGTTAVIGPLTVGTNTTVFADPSGQHVIITDGLTIAGASTNAPAGTVQLHDNSMIVHNGSGGLGGGGGGGGGLLAVRAAIKAGRTGGTWTGRGIVTDLSGTNSGPGAGKVKTLAYALGSDTNLAITSIHGQAIAPTDVLVKYTYVGDGNLDGSVDGLDIAKWAVNFTGALGLPPEAAPAKVWTQGDWNFDGSVDGLDAAIWATNFTGALGGGGLLGLVVDIGPGAEANPAAVAILEGMGITVVPEPATLVLLGLGGLLLATSRRR